ncbi:hypothetical protein BKK79_22055 [Cupriavidus sp. USMAA2-4]|uniref:Uncharacterized protein n=1 Tax=Cupriavidus malaysiensis TaxID=367825 RepID=A0ABN4TT87_9BURK|nr:MULTISPECIES: hypothetical protein [Cupriavidus]AOY94612.1 hypothetical protein BKK79_22055 [Cupriavidus sp. USMAA2-4]AOZ10109.1 hypothetical protein BKK80_31165 [Cupriavidus malaysiensis]
MMIRAHARPATVATAVAIVAAAGCCIFPAGNARARELSGGLARLDGASAHTPRRPGTRRAGRSACRSLPLAEVAGIA